MRNLLRWLLALVMWRFQCSPLWRLWRRWVCRTNYLGGRHLDWTPVHCDPVLDGCGWRGPLRWTRHAYCWTRHGYSGCGADEVEPCDECPRCGEEVYP